jgi:hypothetical protein
MKKILVVLLILSVAWGVFAQDGSWRVSGNVEIGTSINFEPTPGDDNTDNDDARVSGTGYNTWDQPRGRFALIYGTYVNDGALSAGFKWNTRGNGAENNPFFSYNGENFSFSTDLYGMGLLVGGRGQAEDADNFGQYIHRLWGNYKFVNGIVFIQAAYRAEEEEFWISDTTAGGRALGAVGEAHRQTDKVNHHNFFGKPSTFTYNDGGNYLLGDIRLSAINFGLMIPNLLGGQTNFYWNGGSDLGGPLGNGGRAEYFNSGKNGGYLLVDDVLKQTIFGVKFSMAPVEFAAQFKVQHSGAYIGAKFFAGPVTVGASFSGILSPEDLDGDGTADALKFFKVGGDVNFNGGVFAAGLGASLERTGPKDDSTSYLQLLRIQPRFSYNVIPSHLCFALDAGFYFFKAMGASEELLNDITWAVQPQLFWTFLGTGARNGYGWAGPFYQGGPTGLIARYRVVSQGDETRPQAYNSSGTPIQNGGWTPINALDIIFQFNF